MSTSTTTKAALRLKQAFGLADNYAAAFAELYGTTFPPQVTDHQWLRTLTLSWINARHITRSVTAALAMGKPSPLQAAAKDVAEQLWVLFPEGSPRHDAASDAAKVVTRMGEHLDASGVELMTDYMDALADAAQETEQ